MLFHLALPLVYALTAAELRHLFFHLHAKPMDSDTKDAVETLYITEGLNPNQLDRFWTVITS